MVFCKWMYQFPVEIICRLAVIFKLGLWLEKDFKNPSTPNPNYTVNFILFKIRSDFISESLKKKWVALCWKGCQEKYLYKKLILKTAACFHWVR